MNKFALFRIPLRQFSLNHGEWTKCLPKPDYGPLEVQRTVLLNGIKLAAARPQGSPIGACTILYQAGSRYELNDDFGVSHFIRAASSASGQTYSGYKKSRYLPQQGAALTCSGDRQTIAYTLRFPVTEFPDLFSYLVDTAAKPCFHQWEIDDLKPLVWDDIHRITPEQRVIDLAQKACWSGPLSNSMFCEYERIDIMTEETLTNFANENMKTNHCCVASVGVPFEQTMKIAEMIESRREYPPVRSPDFQSAPRRGYEVFDLGPNSATWIAVVVPGCGTCDIRRLMIHAIIAAACGQGNMYMGQHNMDRIPQTPLGTMSREDVYTDYKAFNVHYLETGVFGIVAKTRPCSAWGVAMAAAEFLSNVGELNFKQIEIGKQRLKLSLALTDEDSVKLSEGLAMQMANQFHYDNIVEAMALVDGISPDEVSAAAKSLSSKIACDATLRGSTCSVKLTVEIHLISLILDIFRK